MVAPSESLDHADACRSFLDTGRQVVLLVLDAAGQDAVAPLEPQAQGGHWSEDRGSEQPEQEVEPDQQHDDDNEAS